MLFQIPAFGAKPSRPKSPPRGRLKTAVCGLALVCSSWLATTPTVAQADDSEAFQRLLERVEAIERENAELKRVVNTTAATASVAAPAPDSETPAPPAPGAPDEHIRRIVDVYLADRAATDKAVADEKAKTDLSMSASWNNGFEVQTKNKNFRVHVGGRTQLDAGWYAVDNDVQNLAGGISNKYQDGVDFRRARLRIDGTMYEQIDWAIEYDFVNSIRARNAAGTGTTDFDATAFTDAWWAFKEVPVVGNIKIGNHKEAIGFEHLVSSRWQPFMERSYNQDAFYGGSFNGFLPGISIYDSYDEEMGTWNLGLFKPTDNVFAVNANNGDYSVTGRVTRLLWYECEGAELFHIGFSARQYQTVNDRVRFRTRDAIRTGVSVQWPVPADTGTLLADHGQWLNTEVVGVHDAWTFQSEYLASFLQDAGTTEANRNKDLYYQGGYAQVMYFLTGEHDHYSRKTGVFERVIPRRNFRYMRTDPCACNDGWGAWQVGARYDYLDLNSQGVNGGELNNYTLGLNWFLNPNMKIQFNYTMTERNGPAAGSLGDGNIHGFGMRLAHDF